jgi:glycosyltransferase involved in cell wall biosynthesis
MRILFIADGRSPTTRSFLEYWHTDRHEIHLISTYPCERLPGLASFTVIPVAFSWVARPNPNAAARTGSPQKTFGNLRTPLQRLRYYLGPLSLPFYRSRFLQLVKQVNPEIIHAFRVPFEGMLASNTPNDIPLVVSIWGNDLTLHMHGSEWMASLTRRTLRRATGLVSDTARDIRLGSSLGFSTGHSLVIPGGGGIHIKRMKSGQDTAKLPAVLPDSPIVINPRGHRPGSLLQDVFFQSIPLVLEKIPQTIFVCPALSDDTEALRWVSELGIQANTLLWPTLDQPSLWAAYHHADVYVSPSIHDGTPNSLLEAMACGCFPVVGNIESMQEWITSGLNGLLVDATSPESLAHGLVTALQDPSMRARAREENARIISQRAEYYHCMAMTEGFYSRILEKQITQ